MSTNQNRPPLTPETLEEIKVDQYAVHQSCWADLQPLCVNRLADVFASLNGKLSKPPMPKQPIKLLNLLKGYALFLFRREEKHYPDSAELALWRSSLAETIEDMVMDNVAKIESGMRSLQFHASLDQMRESVREALAYELGDLSHKESQQKERLQLEQSTAHRLEVLIEESRMKNEEVAAAIGISVRSLYRHLDGGTIRKANQQAYVDFLSQKLGRKVTL